MSNKLLQTTKQLVAGAALSGLICATAPVAFAAQVSINLAGTFESNPFTAVISYDSDTPFYLVPGTTTEYVTGESGPWGSITFSSNGTTNTSDIFFIAVGKNGVVNGNSYTSNIFFASSAYEFTIDGGLSPDLFTWGESLLPTEANPVPFNAPEGIPTAFRFHLSPHNAATLDSYSVTSAVPVPAAAWLLGSGLIGLGGLARRRRA